MNRKLISVNNSSYGRHPNSATGSGFNCVKLAFLGILIYLLSNHFIYVCFEAFALDYNEGVYLTSASSLNDGNRLYENVFGSQPPLLFITLKQILFWCNNILACRAFIFLCSVIAVYALSNIAIRLFSRTSVFFACYSLIAFSGFWKNSLAIQAEMPSLAFGLLAIALSTRTAGQILSPCNSFLAGILLSIGLFYKFLILPLVPVLIIANAATQWKNKQLSVASNGNSIHAPGDAKNITRWAKYTLMVIAVLFISVLFAHINYDVLGWYNQSIYFHIVGQDVIRNPLEWNATILTSVLKQNAGSVFLSITGCIALLKNRKKQLSFILFWLLLTLSFIALHSPMFEQHFILLAAPVALLSAANYLFIITFRNYFVKLVILVMLLLLPLCGIHSDPQSQGGLFSFLPASGRVIGGQSRQSHFIVSDLIAKFSRSTDFVVTDNQMEAFKAGRKVAPELTDTSYVRIATGALTSNECINVCRSRKVKVIAISTGRFRNLPSFVNWVKSNYSLQTIENGSEIYILK